MKGSCYSDVLRVSRVQKCRRDKVSDSALRPRITSPPPRLIPMSVNFQNPENTHFFSHSAFEFLPIFVLAFDPLLLRSLQPTVKKNAHPNLDLAFPTATVFTPLCLRFSSPEIYFICKGVGYSVPSPSECLMSR